MPCNEEKERKGKVEDPSGRDFSVKKKQREVFSFCLKPANMERNVNKMEDGSSEGIS
jgi:hypothetical protein